MYTSINISCTMFALLTTLLIFNFTCLLQFLVDPPLMTGDTNTYRNLSTRHLPKHPWTFRGCPCVHCILG